MHLSNRNVFDTKMFRKIHLITYPKLTEISLAETFLFIGKRGWKEGGSNLKFRHIFRIERSFVNIWVREDENWHQNWKIPSRSTQCPLKQGQRGMTTHNHNFCSFWGLKGCFPLFQGIGDRKWHQNWKISSLASNFHPKRSEGVKNTICRFFNSIIYNWKKKKQWGNGVVSDGIPLFWCRIRPPLAQLNMKQPFCSENTLEV